jgi:hypothetical protein
MAELARERARTDGGGDVRLQEAAAEISEEVRD